MAVIEVKIIVDAKSGFSPEDLRRPVTEAGLCIEQIIPALGAIFGSCEEEDVCKLEQIKGILRVSPEGKVQLPPADPDVPQ